MRAPAILNGLALLLLCAPAAAAPPAKVLDHPGEVSLIDEHPKGMSFRQFNTGLPLYVSDRDPLGASSCYLGCASQWPPIWAPDNARPAGDWSVVVRDGGRKQWAYRGKPVYTRMHDSPQVATGDGHDGVWHVLGPLSIGPQTAALMREATRSEVVAASAGQAASEASSRERR